MLDDRFDVSYRSFFARHVLFGEVAEWRVLGLGEELVVGGLEGLVGSLSEAAFQVVLDHHR